MKNLIQNIPVKMWLAGLFSVICLLFTGIILLCEHQIQKGLYDQQMAERWSKEGGFAQISAFFAEDAIEDESYFRGIGQSVDKALQEASIVNENENARLWIDAVSQRGKIVLASNRAYIEVNAFGVSGEFFQFHPQKIVSGYLFGADGMMQDGIVIDEETAWQLFGSSDVEGMQVMAGQVPHYITGVIERPTGRLEEAAGLAKSICYLSMDSLKNYGSISGGFTYEIVMPNPIKGFAYSAMQTAVGSDNQNVRLVENSSRFDFVPLLHIVQEFGIRSMSIGGIEYPYWENIARGQEDIFALLFLIKCLLLLIPGIFLIGLIIYLWKRKTWNFRQLVLWVQDQWYDAGVKRAQKKQNKVMTAEENDEMKETESLERS